jgi:hypothetical protein
MIKRIASLVMVMALVLTVGTAAVRADTPKDPDTNGKAVVTQPTESTSEKKEAKPDEKLRSGMAKLVADTKAGKGKLSAPSQFKPARSNNLTKGQKIAIGVGIAAAVVVVIAVLHVRRHMFDDFKPFGP